MSDRRAISARRLAPGDVAAFVDLMRNEGETIGGSDHRAVLRAVARDALGRRVRVLIPVAVDGGTIVGTMVVLIGGSVPYWRSFPFRHPVASWHLARRRLRRILHVRANRRRGAGSATRTRPALPPAVADDPRIASLQPPGPGDPEFRDGGDHLAFAAMVLVASPHRGRGISRTMHLFAFDQLRADGVTRYDASFTPVEEAPIRMYLALPFTIFRYPGGYFATLQLDDPAVRSLR